LWPPQRVVPGLVEPTPVQGQSTLATSRLRPVERDEVMCRLSAIEEGMLRVEQAVIEERGLSSRMEGVLRALDQRLVGAIETFESRGRESEGALSVQKENVEQWKQLAVTVMKGVKQVVGDATAARMKETGRGVPVEVDGESAERPPVRGSTERRNTAVAPCLGPAKHVTVGDTAVLVKKPKPKSRLRTVEGVDESSPAPAPAPAPSFVGFEGISEERVPDTVSTGKVESVVVGGSGYQKPLFLRQKGDK